MEKNCCCCSGKAYSECCKIFHDGVFPQNALQLMRSRYSAYALKNVAYIMRTTHPKSPHFKKESKLWEKELLDFCLHTLFQKLEIIEFIDGENEAYVTFKAQLEQFGKDASFTEKSRFEKVTGKWLYLRGEFRK